MIKRQGTGATASFTVRKISDGIGVERIFPFYSPNIESIVLNKAGRVRRANCFTSVNVAVRVQESEKRMALKHNIRNNYFKIFPALGLYFRCNLVNNKLL